LPGNMERQDMIEKSYPVFFMYEGQKSIPSPSM